ncbi:MAG: M23 family metallopeptidase [Patescibacteria group bacterium]
MKKLSTHILTLFALSFFFLVISSHNVLAATEVFKVTDPFHADSPLGTNFIHLQTYITLNYKGGDVMLSKNPDGTGDANIGDILYVSHVLQGGFSFSYKAYSAVNCSHWLMPPQDITSYFGSKKAYVLNFQFRDFCHQPKDFSSLYLIQKNIPEPTPTVTPTLTPTVLPSPTDTPQPTSTPTPSPTPQSAFLDLPWDYQSKGLSFNDAALSITSFFDHTYPLLSNQSVQEASEFQEQITTYSNEKSNTKNYSSHDGYDYASLAKVKLGDSVLAAAAGTATYINTCDACGNMILIDHHNGLQTRYMHLQKTGLIVSTPGQSQNVTARQVIGIVGATGRVIPADDRGAHIHFMIVEDRDHDGNFNNNLPDGVLDPYGWQSTDVDPWQAFSFSLNGQSKTGNKSIYLWKTQLASMKKVLSSLPDTFQTGKFTLDFPAGSVSEDTEIELKSAPVIELPEKRSIGSSIVASAKKMAGTVVTQFQKAFVITVDFATYDLTPFKLDTLSLYSSTDGITWERQDTVIDLVNKKATAEVNHFSEFALMADKKDTEAPQTKIKLSGNQETAHWFRSDVMVGLKAKDKHKGSGVAYTMYKVDSADWEQFVSAFPVSGKDHHIVSYYSVDNAGNIEEVKSKEFSIDKNKITVWDRRVAKLKEIVSGIHILTLITNKGEVVFPY